MTVQTVSVKAHTDSTIPFDFEGTNVRTLSIDGEPWFVLADVCKVLGLTAPHMVAKRLKQQHRSTTSVLALDGKMRQAAIVNEAGLYKVIFQSRKPQAERFTDWIAEEVIPSIRKTGSYEAKPRTNEEILGEAFQIMAGRNEELEAKLEEVSPKAEFYDDYVDAEGMFTLNDAAKQLGWRPFIMRQELVEQEVLCKTSREYNEGFEHLPRQAYMNQGYFEVKTNKYVHDTGIKTYSKTLVTPKGMTWLAKRLGEDDGRVRNPRKKRNPQPNPINFEYVPSRFL